MLYFIMGLCGLIGGILCCVGDILLDLKGPENKKLGERGLINSAWDHMNIRRFHASISVAAIAIPLYGLGPLSLAFQMDATAPYGWSLFFKLAIYVGMVGALLIHTFLCLVPVVYKTVSEKSGFNLAETTITEMFRGVYIPLHAYYYILGLAPTIMVITGICAGWLNLSGWWLLITPFPMIIYGAIFRKINPKLFCDIPSIFLPSLGMGMFGLLAMVNL